ncbi:MAG: (deoxy)nucleoside triphosphate pyrophosphohydrolase [Acidobacteria bacterium]|nr:(deoxy)nucleoside triphosphate pyrophosphohydrolase [Acidobacteriota bacterium]
MTTVTAAVIERDGRLLVCRRRTDQSHPLKWEFPGGKVEPGEDPVAALSRELQEELGITAEGAEEITRFPYQYPGRPPILLIFFRVSSYSGATENRIFDEIQWVAPQQLPQLDFLEADIDFVRRLAHAK